MRKCSRCQTQMIENCGIKVPGSGYGIVLTTSPKLFANKLGAPQVAICPSCGEVSIYLEDLSALKQNL